MPTDIDHVFRRLTDGNLTVTTSLAELAGSAGSVRALVAVAVLGDRPALLARAGLNARTSQDRQLVTIAGAYFERDVRRLCSLARDHLADHPDDEAVAWIAAHPLYPASSNPTR